MKLIDSSFEIIQQGAGINDILKHIELCGRVSYKSEDKITDTSAKKFVEQRIADGHTAILEQGTVYLEFPHSKPADEDKDGFVINPNILFYLDNPYSKVWVCEGGSYVTTNYRVIKENQLGNDLDYLCAYNEHFNPRVTVKFITSRAIANELVRHRVFSFVQESTRFCNYAKDKFGEELTFIKPYWYDDEKDTLLKQLYDDTLYNCEQTYLAMIKGGFKPQEARGILVNDLKTEIYMTGFVSDWDKFFKLRTASDAHPDMVKLAVGVQKELREMFPRIEVV